MRELICIIVIIFSFLKTLAQEDSLSLKESNIIGFYPSKNYKTNGLAIKYWDTDNLEKERIVNGIQLGLNPLGIFTPFVTIIHSPEFFSNNFKSEEYDLSKFNVVNGLDLSLVNLEYTKINGLEINFTGGLSTAINGVSIGIINKHFEFNGLEIGVLGNSTTKCRGLQIGLINYCSNLKGVQIGLWNKNQTKSLPIINWSF